LFMAKKKRNSSSNASSPSPRTPHSTPDHSSAQVTDYTANDQNTAQGGGSKAAATVASGQPKPLLALPLEIGRGDWTIIILALMLFFTPALGVPNELMLQDTLKSIIASFMTLGAALVLFWSQRNRRDAVRWHFVMWLPIMLCAYALGSMAWSHTFLAGVEAIRWFVFAVLLWLVLNTASRERFTTLAWAIHLGALSVALLGASQFWFDNRFIPQGPNPAATFVNRNFAAEFLVCTFVFTAHLIFTERRTAVLAFLSGTFGLHLVYLMMCGTRSAYIGGAAAVVMVAVMAWKFRSKYNFTSWSSGQRIVVLGVLVATVLGLGLIKSGNPGIEFVGKNAFERGFSRASSIKADDVSLGIRKVMWVATGEMIKRRPLTGIGAGAWEVDLPLYQAEGTQLETDYYAHNEILQVLAEYGLVGWLFMLSLIGYSLSAAWRTLRAKSAEEMNEGPLRAAALTSLLALMIVSNVGFPWRLATTGVMFAVCLGLLAASDARLGLRGVLATARLPWRPAFSQTAAVLTMCCLALAAYITQQAAEAENKIVSSVKMALTISQGGNPNGPKNEKTKAEMLRLAREGIAITPHYRKITPMLGDELAKWGDWKNAVWVWESVVSSRPYVVAIMSNIARGKAQLGDIPGALDYLQRAKKVQPKAISVRSLEVILLSRSGKEEEALKLAKIAFAENTLDTDMMNAAYILAVRASDFKFAIEAMETRNKIFPDQKVDGLLKIASVELSYLKDENKALATYRDAYNASGKAPQVLAQIPALLQPKL
jgi:O-antigen ligase